MENIEGDNPLLNDLYNDPVFKGSVPAQDMSSEPDSLDTSWILETERCHNIHSNPTRELVDNIIIHYIYINKYAYIEKIVTEEESLDVDTESGFSVLSKENILKKIQSKKILTPTSKYKLLDILSFVVDILPEHVQDFCQSDLSGTSFGETNFFKVLPIFNNIVVEKSIFVFHNIHRLYFIFQEVDLSHDHRTTLKSILKPESDTAIVRPSSGSTKKVRMAETFIERTGRTKRGTRRNRSLVLTT